MTGMQVSEQFLNDIGFKAGQISKYFRNWQKITSDPFILNMVKGAEIPLEDLPDISKNHIKNQVEGDKFDDIDKEIQKLLKLGVIEESLHEVDEIISPIFVRPKSDGSLRIILNLKRFNENVSYTHFKMENLFSASDMMKKDCYLASVDLRHAYYSVPIDKKFRKYLKFRWRNRLYEYTCFPNGLSSCPRDFTKLLKPVYSFLRSKGHLSACFIDDTCLQGETYEACKKNVADTVDLFKSLGFYVHDEKSVLEPCKRLKYLGFWLDSQSMTISPTEDKIIKIKHECQKLIDLKRFTIRQLAQVIGKLVACFPGVQYGKLYYRKLDKLKTDSLKNNKGNFDACTNLNLESKNELIWWIENIDNAYFPLLKSNPEIELKSDASKLGFGSFCNSESAGGRWSPEESEMHINALELKAIENGLKSFEDVLTGKHVKIFTDNTCALSFIRDMGGSKSVVCNDIANRIWKWCIARNIDITISFIAGKINFEADRASRVFNDRTEWKLYPSYFKDIVSEFGTPEIDLFASKLNTQCTKYVSWGRDPEAIAYDAFTIDWSQWKFIYAFPPFCIILRVLKKWSADQAEGVFVGPVWTTAPWYPVLMKMTKRPPLYLKRGKRTLTQPSTGEPHPLHKKIQMAAYLLSGKS